jgi:hypothetical protein
MIGLLYLSFDEFDFEKSLQIREGWREWRRMWRTVN